MQRKRGGLVPIGEVVSGLDDVLAPAIRDDLTPGAALFHRGRSGEPTCSCQRSGPREALHSATDGALPRTNGSFTLYYERGRRLGCTKERLHIVIFTATPVPA